MGLQVIPAYIGAGGYTTAVETDRNLIKTIFGRRAGLYRPGDFKITPTGTARQVSMASGSMFLLGSENSTQGGYFVWSDGNDLYTFASTATNPRIDTLVGRVVDTQYGADAGGSNAYIEIVQGIAAASPVARADSYFNTGGAAYRPGAWWRMADVRINVVDGVLPQGQITETLQYSRQAGRVVCTSTTRPTDAVVGDWIYETDTKFERIYDGTNWMFRPGTIIKRGTNSADKAWTSGGAVAYSRLDSVEIVANQQFIVHIRYRGSLGTSGDTGRVDLYVSTSGSATTGSTLLTTNVLNANGTFAPSQSGQLDKPYSSVTNVTASFLFAVNKTGGTGSFTVNGSSQLTEMWVEAGGPALPDTVVAL